MVPRTGVAAMRGMLRQAQDSCLECCGGCIGQALGLRYEGASGSLAHRSALLGAHVALLGAELLHADARYTGKMRELIAWAASPYDPGHEQHPHG
jgi:hypothetical protein